MELILKEDGNEVQWVFFDLLKEINITTAIKDLDERIDVCIKITKQIWEEIRKHEKGIDILMEKRRIAMNNAEKLTKIKLKLFEKER